MIPPVSFSARKCHVFVSSHRPVRLLHQPDRRAAWRYAAAEASGHQVANQQVIPRRSQRFAGTEAERLADINDLAAGWGKSDCAGGAGGYGASRLLEEH
ncbi:hypothetical protein ACLK2H_06950 [Escherichia coli]